MAVTEPSDLARESLRGLKSIAASARPLQVLPAMMRVLEREEIDYTRARALYGVVKEAVERAGALGQLPPAVGLRVAILSGATSSQLVWLLELFLSVSGIFPRMYEAPYGVWRQEILDPQSALFRFEPHIAILAPGSDSVAIPALGSNSAAVRAALDGELAQWGELWDRLGGAGIEVVQDNFVLPAVRPLGSHEMNIAAAPSRYLADLNAALRSAAPGHVKIHDVEYLASWVGRRAWLDERFHVVAKLPCAVEALPLYASSLASLVRAIRGRARKCLVLDLDNTLWGGVVGDDGVDNLALGQGSPEGEAFLRVQAYVRSLRDRGVVLAVCSKNDDATAREPFLRHPEMVLKLDDIACFVANWNDKASNLRMIAKRLELGLDALVFLDDNPAERAFVRAELSDVAVPELPDDPAGYVAALDRHRYFERAAFTDEDRRRAGQYAENALRQDAEAASGSDLDGFLRGLQMVATIRPLDGFDLARATQLTNKSNQYNLTTRRVSEAEMQKLACDPRRIARTVRLRDRFGDHGLISVVVGSEADDTLDLELWLMSCRVLSRGVEYALLNHLWRAARARGLKRLVGLYAPTAKNGLVRDHYERLGFSRRPGRPDDPPSAARWELVIEGEEPPQRPHIAEEP